MNQPPWMPYAWADTGQHETAGSDTNPRIAVYFRLAGHREITDDETAWCAAFVGACLEQAGVRCSRSLAARSYLTWGIDAGGPQIGAITVLSRGGDPSLGHVGFLVGISGTQVKLLGGNQSDSVSVATFDRSRVIGYRLPAGTVTPPAPAPIWQSIPASSDRGFQAALTLVLGFEGGWSDDPFDPGGATNKGITIADFAREQGVEITAANLGQLKAELRQISDADVARIYLERYWRPARCPDLAPALALFHFDCAVNQGLSGSARMLQEALGVAIDGDLGPLTLAAAHACAQSQTIERYADSRRRRYRNLSTFWRFGRGWLRRVDAVTAAAKALVSVLSVSAPQRSAPPTPPQPKENPPMLPQSSDAPAAVPQQPQADTNAPDKPAKWWGESLTIWGALLTATTTVAPAVFAAFGINISADLLQQLGVQAGSAVQAMVGLIGTVMTIYGRIRATTALQRRLVHLHL